MPDLIIKPEDTVGNKLILQDQAGGAVLTTADSGVDSASTVLATKTGTETLTNKTLDVPTVGDMSNCTFPSDTIRFIDHVEMVAAAGSTNSGSWLETDDAGGNPRLAINVPQATIDLYSKIIVEASWSFLCNSGSAFTFCEFRFVRGDIGQSNGTVYWSDRGSYFGRGTSTTNFLTHVNMHIVDENLPSANAYTGAEYYIQYRPHHGNVNSYSGSIHPLGAETDLGARITAWGVI